MKDRFTAGALAGLFGGALQIIYGYIVTYMGLADRSFHDFGKVFVMSSSTTGLFADVVGLISILSNGAVFGIILAFIISFTSSKYYLVKGLIYGTILWHLFLGAGTMFKMAAFDQIPPGSSFATLIGSIIYGIASAYVLKALDTKTTLL